jgi:ribonucleoside-diphosphate reductase beta chain
MSEAILQENPAVLTLHPLQYPDVFMWYKKQQSSFWRFEEADLSKDYEQFEKLTQDEQYFVKHILAFFNIADGVVNANLAENFINEVQSTEAKLYYAAQMYIEGVHMESYSALVDTYVPDLEEREQVISAVRDFKAIALKVDWAEKWTDASKASWPERLVAFACVEQLLFSGSFCAIYWLKERGILPGLAFLNDLIAADENLHFEFAAFLYVKHVQNKLDEKRVLEIVQEAVATEKEFITRALPCDLVGMNSADMSTYIEYVADTVLTKLGYKPCYFASCPFGFMPRISMDSKVNFFERRNPNYTYNRSYITHNELFESNSNDF